MRINTNVSALNTQRILGQTDAAAAKVIGRLSSGYRINHASDDAAGLGIANKLHADGRSLTQASHNAEQAQSMLQVMEGATSQIQSILERMKELATQSNSATSGADGGSAKTQLNTEFTTLRSELNRIVDTTTFNGQTLLAGGFGASLDTATTATHSTLLAAGMGVYSADLNGAAAGTYTVTDQTGTGSQLSMTKGGVTQTVSVSAGAQDVEFSKFGITLHTTADFAVNSDGTAANTAASGDVVVSANASGSFMVSSSGNYAGADLVSVNAIDLSSAATGLNLDGEAIDTAANAQSALGALDSAIGTLNTKIGTIGAAQNRIDYATQNVKTSIQNFAAAESTIRDADMAQEMTEFSRLQILQQAGTAMLAQANQAPQQVLQLFR